MKCFHRPLIKSQKNQGFGRAYWSSFPRDSKGQAVIEYLLIVCVVVILMYSLVTTVFKPLSEFVDRFNRVYVQCLLETGELPLLHSEEEQTICGEVFPTLVLLDDQGNPIPPAKGKGEDDNRENNTGNADRSGSESGSEARSSAVSGAPPRNRKSTLLRNAMRSKGNAQPEVASNVTNIPVDEFNAGNGYMNMSSSNAYGGNRRQRTRKIAIDGLMEFERKKLEREKQKVSTRPVSGDESFTGSAKKKIVVKPPPAKAPELNDDIGGGFGFYLRILIIVFIIAFLFILLGGQALQISKNWE